MTIAEVNKKIKSSSDKIVVETKTTNRSNYNNEEGGIMWSASKYE